MMQQSIYYCNLKTSNLNEHYSNRHGCVQSGNGFSTLKIKRAWFDSGGTLLKQAFVPMEKQLLLACCKVTFLCSKKRALYSCWRICDTHVNYIGNSYYLRSDKGYERILWKLRGYECVQRLRTTVLGAANQNMNFNCERNTLKCSYAKVGKTFRWLIPSWYSCSFIDHQAFI